jgi:tRNA A-37 threonylcarbamoyl transferase component Bud32
MNYEKIKSLKLSELKKYAEEMYLDKKQNKEDLINDITNSLKKYDSYNRKQCQKYKKIKQIGASGIEGTTYLVETKDGKYYAMKTFKNFKNADSIKKEATLQKMTSDENISPNILEVDLVNNFIVMDKMDGHLTEKMKKQNGNLNKTQQMNIINIFKKLDKSRVFHGDANILNYMYKDNELYIIDYGMSKEITPELIKKLNTENPNMKYMLVGFIIKLKEMKCPDTAYKYLLNYVSKEDKEKYKF